MNGERVYQFTFGTTAEVLCAFWDVRSASWDVCVAELSSEAEFAESRGVFSGSHLDSGWWWGDDPASLAIRDALTGCEGSRTPTVWVELEIDWSGIPPTPFEPTAVRVRLESVEGADKLLESLTGAIRKATLTDPIGWATLTLCPIFGFDETVAELFTEGDAATRRGLARTFVLRVAVPCAGLDPDTTEAIRDRLFELDRERAAFDQRERVEIAAERRIRRLLAGAAKAYGTGNTALACKRLHAAHGLILESHAGYSSSLGSWTLDIGDRHPELVAAVAECGLFDVVLSGDKIDALRDARLIMGVDCGGRQHVARAQAMLADLVTGRFPSHAEGFANAARHAMSGAGLSSEYVTQPPPRPPLTARPLPVAWSVPVRKGWRVVTGGDRLLLARATKTRISLVELDPTSGLASSETTAASPLDKVDHLIIDQSGWGIAIEDMDKNSRAGSRRISFLTPELESVGVAEIRPGASDLAALAGDSWWIPIVFRGRETGIACYSTTGDLRWRSVAGGDPAIALSGGVAAGPYLLDPATGRPLRVVEHRYLDNAYRLVAADEDAIVYKGLDHLLFVRSDEEATHLDFDRYPGPGIPDVQAATSREVWVLGEDGTDTVISQCGIEGYRWSTTIHQPIRSATPWPGVGLVVTAWGSESDIGPGAYRTLVVTSQDTWVLPVAGGPRGIVHAGGWLCCHLRDELVGVSSALPMA